MLLAIPLVILSAALAVQANIDHGVPRHNRHRGVSVPRALPLQNPTQPVKRKSCKAPTTTSKAKATTTYTTTTKKPTTTKKTTAAAKATAAIKASVDNVIQIEVSRCGSNGATTKISKTAGPNGSIDWINCGLTGKGWDPPFLTVKDVVTVDLTEALKSSSSPFHACSAYLSYFNEYGKQYGVAPIMLAAFAMQESSCDPSTVGGGGEQGLMQLSQDKCGGAPNGNCRDPNFNIKTGAKYFSQTLSDNNGNLLLSIGEYNGWYEGLTVAKAQAARYTSCCRCQNNLDYLFQWLNGWILNENAYSLGLGKYFNLDVCGGDD